MTTNINLATPVNKLYMVGATYARRLNRLEIKTVNDLINHFPTRYEDFKTFSAIKDLQTGEVVTITAKVLEMKNVYTKYGKRIQKATVTDNTGQIEITWYNQPFLTRTIKKNLVFNFSGKISQFNQQLIMEMPEFEEIKEGKLNIHTGRLIPIYPQTHKLSSKWLRSRIAPLLNLIKPYLQEYLPSFIRQQNRLIDYQSAYQQIHFPDNQAQAKSARQRLAFDELFLYQLSSHLQRLQWQKQSVGQQLEIGNWKLEIGNFINSLPFKLTNAQIRCVKEILADLAKTQPMNRLLEGDVGSGKTVVATIAMYTTYLNGFQSLLMAPTEILAFQHYQTIDKLLGPLGLKIALHTRSHQKHLQKENRPDYDIIIGTHALLNQKIQLDKIALVVIDEQHRFGVEQRAKLTEKGLNPHLLTMTATPIPRTAALVFYQELDLSIIDEMPPGRQTTQTWLAPNEKRSKAYQWISKQIKEAKLLKNTDKQIKQTSQAFIICPLIEESESLQSVRAATAEYKRLKDKVFPDFKLGLIHGRLKISEKNKIIKQMRENKLDILVATPVVEVGIDLPNTNIILIEASDRFGLAQLHQLRGRIGRRGQESFCLLFSESNSPQTRKRLKALENINIGMELAELDLRLRGPGEIHGIKQHGIPNLKIASLFDNQLIKAANDAVSQLLDKYKLADFPALQDYLKRYKIKKVLPN